MFQGEVRHHVSPEVSPLALHVGGKSNGNSRSLANDQLKVREICLPSGSYLEDHPS